MDVNAVRAHAGLAGVAEFACQDVIGRAVDIGISEDDKRSMATELQGNALNGFRRLTVQQDPHLGAAGKGQLANASILEELVGDGSRLVGRNDLEGAARTAHFEPVFLQEDRSNR
ncbi:hypothetical protein D9M71_771080 [compost metagenome]